MCTDCSGRAFSQSIQSPFKFQCTFTELGSDSSERSIARKTSGFPEIKIEYTNGTDMGELNYDDEKSDAWNKEVVDSIYHRPPNSSNRDKFTLARVRTIVHDKNAHLM